MVPYRFLVMSGNSTIHLLVPYTNPWENSEFSIMFNLRPTKTEHLSTFSRPLSFWHPDQARCETRCSSGRFCLLRVAFQVEVLCHTAIMRVSILSPPTPPPPPAAPPRPPPAKNRRTVIVVLVVSPSNHQKARVPQNRHQGGSLDGSAR